MVRDGGTRNKGAQAEGERTEMDEVAILFLFIALGAAFVQSWMLLRPVIEVPADWGPKLPYRFSLSELGGLVVLVQVALTSYLAVKGPELGASRFVGGTIVSISAVLLWWAAILQLNRAGVRHQGRRIVYFILLPVVSLASVVWWCFGLYLVATLLEISLYGFQRWHEELLVLIAVELGLVGLLVLCRRLVWWVAQPAGRLSRQEPEPTRGQASE